MATGLGPPIYMPAPETGIIQPVRGDEDAFAGRNVGRHADHRHHGSKHALFCPQKPVERDLED